VPTVADGYLSALRDVIEGGCDETFLICNPLVRTVCMRVASVVIS